MLFIILIILWHRSWKTEIVEPEEIVPCQVTAQWTRMAATDKHVTIEELLEAVSSMRSVPMLYDKDISRSNKKLVLGSRWRLIPRQTDRLTIGRNIILISTFVLSCEMIASRQRRKHESSRISIVRNRKRATASEDCNRLVLDVCSSYLLSV
jgi:hypothetical protein